MPEHIERRAVPRAFTLVLRLLPEHGASGNLVGHAEVVATSETVVITCEDDLIHLVRRLSAGAVLVDGH